MISGFEQFPLMLLKDCVYSYLHHVTPILREININEDFRVYARENKYNPNYYVNLYRPKYEGLALLNPMQYILKAEINDRNRLSFELYDQDELSSNGYSTIPNELYADYVDYCIRIINEVNELLDRIGDSNFPKSWSEYKELSV